MSNHPHQLKWNDLTPNLNLINPKQINHNNYILKNGIFSYDGINVRSLKNDLISVKNEIIFLKQNKILSTPIVAEIPEHYALYQQRYTNEIMQHEISVFKEFTINVLLEVGRLRIQQNKPYACIDNDLEINQGELVYLALKKKSILECLDQLQTFNKLTLEKNQIELYQLKQNYNNEINSQKLAFRQLENDSDVAYSRFLKLKKTLQQSCQLNDVVQQDLLHYLQLIKMTQNQIDQIKSEFLDKRYKRAVETLQDVNEKITQFQELKDNILRQLCIVQKAANAFAYDVKKIAGQAGIEKLIMCFNQLQEQVYVQKQHTNDLIVKNQNQIDYIYDESRNINILSHKITELIIERDQVITSCNDAQGRIQESIDQMQTLEQKQHQLDLLQTQIEVQNKLNQQFSKQIFESDTSL
ncbi:hypothetical protein SS50377_20275 [Spironucleus salmonicida]|uniref:Uncharacterized protein n=1 Tax=Spironucleus salmonicida TaxID=348837 RepID=V6LM82_9EUKA|nr:hypothetical protein SS50377_20275 [Spironucleus salmonicida]|eukprot:EST45328.1 Hypothetical protein SS50377_14906 [Spironucleus salmonicida]